MKIVSAAHVASAPMFEVQVMSVLFAAGLFIVAVEDRQHSKSHRSAHNHVQMGK